MRSDDVSLSDSARFSGSCVVDVSGKALTLYHGTPVGERNGMTIGDITSFDRLYTQKMFGRTPGIDQIGSWFSDNPGSTGAGMYTPDVSGVMYPVHLAIKNPWEVSFSGLKREMNRHSHAPMDTWNDARPTEKGVNGLRAYLAEVGFDGIKILHDRYAENGSTEFENQNVWIALEPEQVIFAIGSNLHIECGQSVTEIGGDTVQSSEVKRIKLQAMTTEARAVIVAALTISVKLPAAVEPAVEQNTVHQGTFSGRIMGVSHGVVTQKINREGATVCHNASRLSCSVAVGDVVDIGYMEGRGVISGIAKEMREVGR